MESVRKRRRKKKGNVEDGMEINSSGDESDGETEEAMEVDMERLSVTEGAAGGDGAAAAAQPDSQNVEGADGIFTVKIGPQSNNNERTSNEAASSTDANPDIFVPHPRMSALMAVKNGILYLYGGIYEVGDKQLSLCDMYSLDLHKLDEWKTIIPSNLQVEVSLFTSVLLLLLYTLKCDMNV